MALSSPPKRPRSPAVPSPMTPTSTQPKAADSSGMTPRAQAWFQKIAHLSPQEQRQATDLLLRLSKRLREKRANVAAREAAKKPNPSA